MTYRAVLCLVILTIAFAQELAHSHSLEQSYIFLRIYDDTIAGRFEITVGDLNDGLGLDFKTDRTVTLEEVDAHIDAIKSYLLKRVSFAPNGVPVDMRLTGHSLFTISLAQYVVVEFVLDDLPKPPQSVDVDYAVLFDVLPEHRGLLVVEHNWKTSTFDNEAVVSLVFGPSSQSQRLDLSSSSVLRGFAGMLQLGVHHIWVGIDHILFLFALLLPSVVRRTDRGWESTADFRAALIHVVKVVTVFTIAHTITLSLAALSTITLSPRLVESVIAISITIVALDIIFPFFKGRVWWIVFGFGLFHGFGFASVLSSIGIPQNYMVHSLLGFNLGVEIGQVAIVCIIFPFLFAMRKAWLYSHFILPCSALLLMLVSLYWFIERAFEVDLPAGQIVQQLLGIVL